MFIKSRKNGSASHAIRIVFQTGFRRSHAKKAFWVHQNFFLDAFAEICEIVFEKMKSRTMCPQCLRKHRNEEKVRKYVLPWIYDENDCFFRPFFNRTQFCYQRKISLFYCHLRHPLFLLELNLFQHKFSMALEYVNLQNWWSILLRYLADHFEQIALFAALSVRPQLENDDDLDLMEDSGLDGEIGAERESNAWHAKGFKKSLGNTSSCRRKILGPSNWFKDRSHKSRFSRNSCDKGFGRRLSYDDDGTFTKRIRLWIDCMRNKYGWYLRYSCSGWYREDAHCRGVC